MNQANQIRGDSQQYKLWFEAKKFLKIQQKGKNTRLGFNKGKNYNPMKHCKWYNWIKNYIKLSI